MVPVDGFDNASFTTVHVELDVVSETFVWTSQENVVEIVAVLPPVQIPIRNRVTESVQTGLLYEQWTGLPGGEGQFVLSDDTVLVSFLLRNENEIGSSGSDVASVVGTSFASTVWSNLPV